MAGTVTRAYRGPNNLTDWYLPSKDELNELCKYARQQTDNNPSVRCSRTSSIRSGFSESTMYGSSTEGTNADGRHMQYFDYGDQSQFVKAFSPLTRAIRAFTTSSLSTYSVAYNGNTSGGGSPPSDGTAYASGATVTVAGNTGLLTKTGYTFDGWCTTQPAAGSACGGTSRAAASTFTLSSHTTLYAVWTDTTAPTVSSLSPADNATNVAGDTNLVVTFSENVTAVAGKYVRICTNTSSCTGSSVAGDVVQVLEATNAAITISSAQVTINPASDLSGSTTYYVSIDSGAFRDAALNDYTGLTAGTSWNFATAASSCASGGVCVVGDTGPGGGIVFYVASSDFTSTSSDCGTTCRYLEAATADQSTGIDWCSNTYMSLNVTSTGIGNGMANTTTADTTCTSGAIQIAADYSNNGKTDWHLPSKDELNELCKYARTQTTGDTGVNCASSGSLRAGFSAVAYWSSSEEQATNAWNQYFSSGYRDNELKVLTGRVRPVRAF